MDALPQFLVGQPVSRFRAVRRRQGGGFIGTIFSTRRLLGRMEPICSLSSWIVLEEHRNASLLLLKPILAMREFTIVNLTPAPVVYEIFSKLGFKPLESERFIAPPPAGPWPAIARC